MRRRNVTPEPKRRPYRRVNLDEGDDKKSWRRRTNFILIFLLIITALAALAFGLAIGEWTRDGKARSVINTAGEMLKMAQISLMESQTIADATAQQKAQTVQLQTQITALKAQNANQTELIMQVGVNNTLALVGEINQTIYSKQLMTSALIQQLNETLQSIRSMANANQENLLDSGSCTLQAVTNTPVTWRFYSQQVGNLTVYYYVFDPTAFVTVNSGTTEARITACSVPILGGIAQQTLTLQQSLDRFESTPANWVAGVTSEGQELILHKNPQTVVTTTGQIRIRQAVTYWLQFF